MKKIISKILIIFIVVVIMFEFVFSSNVCNAKIEESELEGIVNTITNLAGGIVSILLWEKRLTAVGLSFSLDILVANVARESGINGDETISDLVITPFNIFFNKYKLLDVNFFDLDGVDSSTITYTFRTTVAKWYYVMRLISIIILLVILIYVGIRMALSTIAEDRAKYKKMLIDWCASLALVFVLHYIAIFVIYCNEAIVSALESGITDVSNESSIAEILIDIGLRGALGVGITGIAAVLVFVFIVFQTIAFLIAYINRVLKVGFLLIIAPLISITYSIDKMGDGKAQALGNWLREFIYTILIQPFHCIMYIAFVMPAMTLLIGNDTSFIKDTFGSIATLVSPEYNQLVNGVLAILCLKFINDGEKIVRKIFGFQDDNSSTSMAAGMAVGMLAVKNAKKYGKTARNFANKTKNISNRLGTAFKNDVTSGKIGNGKLAQLANKVTGGKFNKGIESLKEKYNSTTKAGTEGNKQGNNTKNESLVKRAIRGCKSPHEKLKAVAGKGGVKGYLAGKYLQHNSLSSTLGMMGAAMAYSSGSTDALSAIGVGAGIQKGTQEYFGSSSKTMASNEADENAKADAEQYDRLESDIEALDEEIKGDKEALEDDESLDDYKKARADEKGYGDKAAGYEKIVQDESQRAEKLPENSQERARAEESAKKAKEKAEEFRAKEAEAKRKADLKNEASGGRLEKISQDRIGFQNNIHNKEKDLENKRIQRSNFYNDREIIKRRKERKKPSESELQAKKNEIVQKLRALKVAEKAKQMNVPANSNVELTADEEDSIGKTAEALIGSIEGRASLPGSDINMAKQSAFVRRQLGLGGDSSVVYRDLWKATSEFRSLELNKEIAAEESKSWQLGLNRDNYNSMTDGYTIEKSKSLAKARERAKRSTRK